MNGFRSTVSTFKIKVLTVVAAGLSAKAVFGNKFNPNITVYRDGSAGPVTEDDWSTPKVEARIFTSPHTAVMAKRPITP